MTARALFSLLAAVLLHELGHLAAARLFGVPIRACRAHVLGGRLTFDFSRAGYGREALVHAAGPAVGLLSALVFRSTRLADFAGLSFVLAALNFLPLAGFDGAGLLRCAVCAVLPPDRAEGARRADRLLRGVSLGAGLLFWLLAARLALKESRLGILLFATGALCGLA